MTEDSFYLMTDQPTTCPKCGIRTTFEEFGEGKGTYQTHKCIGADCGYEFVVVDDLYFLTLTL
jgi:hypothetical protein